MGSLVAGSMPKSKQSMCVTMAVQSLRLLTSVATFGIPMPRSRFPKTCGHPDQSNPGQIWSKSVKAGQSNFDYYFFTTA